MHIPTPVLGTSPSLPLKSRLTAVIFWLLASLLPTGLLLASGFVFNTDTIANATSQQAGWIILLILGILALGPPFFFSYHRFNYIWEASSHVGGGAYKFALTGESTVPHL
jgi:hypothetical protein